MHESFDPTPVRELSPDESPTPLWLSALGVALLVVGAAVWLAGGRDEAPSDARPAASAAPSGGKAASPDGARP
ncbi:MAG: hypothetical protein FJ095_13395 [Deltaproteobacteria bacterium]|nr:hypothetical protein [Deltaproteobacteria bacterium]